MLRDAKLKALLQGASVGLEQARRGFSESRFDRFPVRDRETWLTAALIHLDSCRLVVAYSESEPGISKLLWIGDLLSQMLEARDWVFRHGNPVLLQLHGDSPEIKVRLRSLGDQFRVGGIEEFRQYRHKVGHHYSLESSRYMDQLGEADAGRVHELIKAHIGFMKEWIALLREGILSSVAGKKNGSEDRS